MPPTAAAPMTSDFVPVCIAICAGAARDTTAGVGRSIGAPSWKAAAPARAANSMVMRAIGSELVLRAQARWGAAQRAGFVAFGDSSEFS